MSYRFEFNEPEYFGGDDGEGTRRAGMTIRKSVEYFEAETDDAALVKVIGIMRERSARDPSGKIKAEAISLHRVVDISALRQANAA